ncbi:hypothetical protein ABE65_010385 [Fictibacillus phosphorivorans]|uniref:Homeodomain phBC6A51-type domain-containing protein n=1 Tax=Fictibacillus phosphorivorans TaxID=1221500 RepID=A0A160IMH3_9BACL|nr:phBC6A51 family helix-turn-helix protein [Fictibacillus phosphorivorans]ANC77187.1 hypothetical protein ABE65_010385 [Fictibacillus phosphorivorans]
MKELPQNKQHAAFLIASGMMEKQDIAMEVGINRGTLWLWEKSPEMIAEVDRLKREMKTQGQNFLMGKVNRTVNEIYNLAMNGESEKVRLDALKYIADQSLGKAVSKMEIALDSPTGNNFNDNDIKQVFDTIEVEE